METLNENQAFLSIENALNKAFEAVKNDEDKRKHAYVWKQRFKKGTLSHKKISEILEEAGFKKVVEEQWIKIPTQRTNKYHPVPPHRGEYIEHFPD